MKFISLICFLMNNKNILTNNLFKKADFNNFHIKFMLINNVHVLHIIFQKRFINLLKLIQLLLNF